MVLLLYSARQDYEISSLLALTRLNLHKHKTHILANNKSEILQKYYTEILQNNQRLTPIAYSVGVGGTKTG